MSEQQIDLRKMNVLTDSMYDTTGTQYSTPSSKERITYTTPFEQQAKYNMRAANKPFQASKYPTNGTEWYAKRAVNDVDLQTDMNKVLPDQQVQNWSRSKTAITQSSSSKEKYSFKDKVAEIRKRRAGSKRKEHYITSPYREYEDTWSQSGRIRDAPETFTVMGKELSWMSVAIVILVIVLIVIAAYVIYRYVYKKQKLSGGNDMYVPSEYVNSLQNMCKRFDEENRKAYEEAMQKYSTPTFGTVKTYDSNTYTNTDSQHTTNTLANTISPANLDEVNDDVSTSPINNYNAEDDIESTKTSGGAPQVLNCGNICGGAAFDTRITV